jgi:hypothetical protein
MSMVAKRHYRSKKFALFNLLVFPTDLLERLEIRIYSRQMSNFAACINPD